MALYTFQCAGDPPHYWEKEEEMGMSELVERIAEMSCPRCNSLVTAATRTSNSQAFAAFQAAVKKNSVQITPNG